MPVALRATVTPLARLSPTGKLIVEVVGLLSGSGARNTNRPGLAVTVRLPVTAIALAGTLPRPVTWNVRATSGVEGARQAVAGPGVEQAGRRERDEGGATLIGDEVAGHVEDEVGRRGLAAPIRRAQRSGRPEGHGHPVGPGVPDREVQRRAGRAVDRIGVRARRSRRRSARSPSGCR